MTARREKSGNRLSFSKRGTALVGQEMFKILDRASLLEREGNVVCHLELGSPKSYPPGRIINKTITSLLDTKVGYTSSSGLFGLREGLADFFSKKVNKNISYNNVAISPANLLITQLIDIICDPSDNVALFLPAFPTYLASCQYTGLNIKQVILKPENAFKLTRQDIDAAFKLKPKLVIVNSANNPTGAVYDKDVLIYLLDSARKKNCWIISDETYGLLDYNNDFYSLLNLEYNKLIVISSFSKIFSIPGFRIGYAIADKNVIEKITLSSSTLYSCLPIFTQEGALQGINILDEFTAFMKKFYKKLCNECIAILKKAENISYVIPQSAFYIFINIEKTKLDDILFCSRLLDEYHVAVTPGTSFGYKNFVRVAICGDRKMVKEGLRKIVAFSNKLQCHQNDFSRRHDN